MTAPGPNDTRTQPGGDGKFGFDPAAAVTHLRSSDAKLARLIDAAGPFRMQLHDGGTTFASLSRAIVYQQLNGTAAATIYGRVCALFPRASKGPTARQVLGASHEKLRSAGLSNSKALSLRDLAQKVAAGEVPTLAEAHGMDDAEIIESLTEVRGVGRWTADMFLMFTLGRPDVLPLGDYGVRNGFKIAFRKRELPEPAALEKHGARWKPYRSVASWYLWRAVELARE